MYLMDTDKMTLLEQANPEALRLKNRIAVVPPDDLATTIISYEEQTRGWLAISAQARTPHAQVLAYSRLKRHLQLYSKIAVIDFDERAAAEFVRLKQAKIRIGTMDLKIAAIALVHGATC
jgi:tRNA(fMet)-specific endonuclease VapC